MVRPFRYGDIFLVQRLSRQATKLNIVQATLHRQSAVENSLSSILPWNHGKITTYILRQRGNMLAKDGLLQVQKRHGAPELDIVHLAPGLDARRGHPAIWEKLLSYHTYETAKHRVERVYADVPDQPLPVNTFARAGYRTFDRMTIWRMTPHGNQVNARMAGFNVRPQAARDAWPLSELYRQNVPEKVQMAHGMVDGGVDQAPSVTWRRGGNVCSFVLTRDGTVLGSVQIVRGKRGNWIRPWYDFFDPDMTVVNELIRFALAALHRWSSRLPVYAAVSEYHGALGTALEDHSYAPALDCAAMVKHVRQRLHQREHAPQAAMETAPTIAASPYTLNPGNLNSDVYRSTGRSSVVVTAGAGAFEFSTFASPHYLKPESWNDGRQRPNDVAELISPKNRSSISNKVKHAGSMPVASAV